MTNKLKQKKMCGRAKDCYNIICNYRCLDKLMLIFALLCLFIQEGSAQTVNVTGIVTEFNGSPLPGASVRIKNSTTVVLTDANGKYSIKLSNSEQILTFSYTGFKTVERKVGALKTINVSLIEDSNTLNEMVVVGYGSQKRSDLTGAVGSVKMTDFEKAPVKSYDQALAGRVAGVQVSTGDGQPGTVADIVIRGAGSITQDTSPLYVIDGFPSEGSEANSISPNDIESIDILKDASATAIYGARGSNGVILITTKRGKIGTPKISYNTFYGVTKTPKTMNLMDGYEYVRLMLERNSTRANSGFTSATVTLEDYRNARSYDWQNYIYQTGINQNHDLAVRGGANGTTYSVSLNYNDQQGVIKYSGFKRYQGRVVLDQSFSKKLKVGINSNYSYTETKGLPVNANQFYASSGFLYSVWGYRPVLSLTGSQTEENLFNDLYDPENENNGQDYRVNPILNLSNQKTIAKTTTALINGYAEYALTPKLKLRVSAGFNKTDVERNIFNNSLTQSGSKYTSNGVNGTFGIDNRVTLLNDNVLTYKNTFNKKHTVTLIGGYGTQSSVSSYRGMTAKQITDEVLDINALDMVPPANTSISSTSSLWRMQSFFGRLNYDYKGKYLFTSNFRADGSSKFAPGKKWGHFPSVSAAWRFSKENFIKNYKWLSDGKIRIGYGESGNNRVTDFAYISQANLTNMDYWYAYNNQPILSPGFVITAAENIDLQWETNKQTNIGLDLSLFNKRIDLTVDIYNRITNNLLLQADLPYAFGILNSKGFKNVGSLENRGLEITLGTTNIKNNNFSWMSNFNISFNSNKIIRLTEGSNSILSGNGTFFDTTYSGLYPYISVKGRPLGEMYGLIFDGVYQFSDFDKLPNGKYLLKPDIATNGVTRAAISPGDIRYKDLNGDLNITADDYTIIGRGLPIHTGGFSNNFTYKNWDLNIFFQWSYGNHIINANRYVFEGGITGNFSLNQFASYANRWTPDNPSNTLFRVGGYGPQQYSSRVIEDGSYLRLKTAQLGYNFKSNGLKKMGVEKINVNVSAQNLLTFTNYSGLDPEASARRGNLTPGFDYGTYPQARTITFGLSTTF